MSSFVCSDHTILAIVEGMRKYGLIARKKAESRDMCEALRFINEYQTCRRYADGHIKEWAVEQDHKPVTAAPREYTDGETIAAINCYLYQIGTGALHDPDFITLVAAVKLLREKIAEQNDTICHAVQWGSDMWRELDPVAGCYVDVNDKYGWDLAA